jgi:hypothetical protein
MSFLCHFGVILALFWRYYAVIFSVILALFWRYFDVIYNRI